MKCRSCYKQQIDEECVVHGCLYMPKKTITNGDRIRSMSDDELAEFILNDLANCYNTCKNYTDIGYGGCISSRDDCKKGIDSWIKEESE